MPPQGKKFFGDGIGFWVMESPYWQEGDLHGVSHAFVGASLHDLLPSLLTSLPDLGPGTALSVCDSTSTRPLCSVSPPISPFLFLPPCRRGGCIRHLPQHGARNAASGRGGFCQQWGPQSGGSPDRFRRMVRMQTLFCPSFPSFPTLFVLDTSHMWVFSRLSSCRARRVTPVSYVFPAPSP